MILVRDLMSTCPSVITPDSSLMTAVSIMNNVGCRQIPVRENGKLVGIITDRDIRLAINSVILESDLADRIELLDSLAVAQCMSTDLVVIGPDEPLYKAADLLSLHRFGALPVVSSSATAGADLLGIITVTDILKHMANQFEPINV